MRKKESKQASKKASKHDRQIDRQAERQTDRQTGVEWETRQKELGSRDKKEKYENI